MKYTEVKQKIKELCNNQSLDFSSKSVAIEKLVASSTTEDFLELLDRAGIIPESFGHDTTEEKLFAKYCDSLLARALRELGLRAEIIVERSDTADVKAKAAGYTIVGDAKAFRLSRTAKNQKDFKVEALNQWRRDAEYACLVCPLYQYPQKSSQIYHQATRLNVVLLSYTHLSFLIRNSQAILKNLQKLWEVCKDIKIGKDAQTYWASVSKIVLELTKKREVDFKKAVNSTYDHLHERAEEEIAYLEAEKQRVKNLGHEIAINELIKALKIDEKIATIKKSINAQ